MIAARCFVLLLFLAACGKVGAPLPPFIRIPEAVTDLAVTQSGNDLVLTWTNPPRYIDGSAATNLVRVRIQAGGESLATVNVNAAGQPQSYMIPTGPITSGQRTFTVVVETSQGKLSAVSNVAAIVPVEVPGRVLGLFATADQRRIILEWNRPKENPDLVEAYIVTRTDIPAEPQTVTDTRHEDTRYEAGKEFTYHVTAVRRAGDKLVMGIGPETASVVAEDKKPPGVPTGIEITQSVLTWDPNPESDLAGYRVFRSERADAGFMPVTDGLITTNVFFDPAYRAGMYYAVSAVDESRNESTMSAPFRAP